MQRTNQNKPSDPDPINQYKKIGGGAFYYKGRRILPGQIFSARKSELPSGALDLFKQLEPQEAKQIKEITKLEPQIQRRAKGWYDVFDSKGEQVNDRGLRKEDATELYNDLMTQYHKELESDEA